MTPSFENDHDPRVAERMSALLSAAFRALGSGEYGAHAYDLSGEAIELAVDMDAEQFVALAPQSMVSVVDAEGYEGKVVRLLADAIDLRAEMLESQGEVIVAEVRRQQSAALRTSLDRSRAN